MQNDSPAGNGEEPPSYRALKEFRAPGKGFWRNVSDQDWNDWHWQLKHRVTTVEQLQRLMPTLTPEERAGTALANHKLALAITPYFFNLIDQNAPDMIGMIEQVDILRSHLEVNNIAVFAS